MYHHMKCIKWLSWSVQYKMPLHLHHILLQFQVLIIGNSFQYSLYFQNLVHRNLYGKLAPIKNVTEWQCIVIRNNHRDTAYINCLDESRASHFEPARAQAKLAPPHRFHVILAFGKIFMYLNFIVLILPMLEQKLTYVSMGAPGKKCKNRSTLRGTLADSCRG